MGKKETRGRPGTIKPGSDLQRTELRALSPEELAWRSQQGCHASFAELVERYAERLLHFLHYKTNNMHDAEDLVQDTFVKAYMNIHRYQNSWKFSTWLFTIAARLAISHYRSAANGSSVGQTQSGNFKPVDVIEQKETRQSLWAVARALSENQYQALWLRYAEDMSIKEISQVLRKSQVNVKVILYRARVNLAKRLRNMAAENGIKDQVSWKEALAYMKVEGTQCSVDFLD
ncbi:MAG: RNA polymerase sigma factor [Planctomycetota bacterium]|jgi:RNA polymerase sigma-70 factor (ECF subfamily)